MVIFVFAWGDRVGGKDLGRSSSGSFGRVSGLSEGLGEALVMLASECDYSLKSQYALFCFFGALSESKS